MLVVYNILMSYVQGLVKKIFQFFGTNSIIYSFFVFYIIENTNIVSSFIRKLFGVHHIISKNYIQDYLDEFYYKVNRRYSLIDVNRLCQP